MPPSPVVVEVPAASAPRPSASLACADSDPKLMPAIVMGMSRLDRAAADVRFTDDHIGSACLAIPLEGVPRHRGAQHDEIIESREFTLRPPPPNLDRCRCWPLGGSPRSRCDQTCMTLDGATLCSPRCWSSAFLVMSASCQLGVDVIHVEVVELTGRPVAP